MGPPAYAVLGLCSYISTAFLPSVYSHFQLAIGLFSQRSDVVLSRPEGGKLFSIPVVVMGRCNHRYGVGQ